MSLFIVDDNFLSESEINEVKNKFYSFPVKYTPFTVFVSPEYVSKSTDTYSNRFMYSNNMDKDSLTNELSLYILEKFCIKHSITYKEVSRIRSNTTFLCNEKRPSIPHIDSINQHMVLLYYVNDSDGDTVFYETPYDEDNYDRMIAGKSVSPKAGRAVMFDGSVYHSSHYPNFHDLRSVININIIGAKINVW